MAGRKKTKKKSKKAKARKPKAPLPIARPKVTLPPPPDPDLDDENDDFEEEEENFTLSPPEDKDPESLDDEEGEETPPQAAEAEESFTFHPGEGEAIPEHEAFDIFVNVGEELAKQDRHVYYHISKNSEFCARKEHPYSWEDLMKDFGGGFYRVDAKDAESNHILRRQSRRIAHQESERAAKSESRAEARPATPSFFEMLSLLTKEREATRRETLDAKTGENASMTTMFTTLAQMQRDSQLQLVQMIQESQKQMHTILEKMDEKQMRLMERFQDSLKDREGRKPEMDPITLLKLMKDSEKQGFEMMKTVQTMSDEKAEERAEILAKIESLEKGEKKSATDKLIESVLPAISKGLMSQAQQGGGQAAPPPRPAAFVPANRAVAPVRRLQPAPASQRPPEAPSFEEQKRKELVMKSKITELLVPHVGQWLTRNVKTKDAAQAALALLADHGLSREVTLRYFSEPDLFVLAKKYGLPPAANAWLKEFYGYLKAPASEAASADPGEAKETSSGQVG